MAVPALIPAAGEGTRLRPITRFVPKPMLPIGRRPVVDFALREALRAGCRPVVVVTAPDASALKRYVRDHEHSEDLRVAEQSRPRGLADALRVGYDALTSTPKQAAYLLPDNVVLEGSGTRPLLEPSVDPDRLVFGVIRVNRDEASYFGNSGGFEADPEPGETDTTTFWRITSLQAKNDGTFRAASDTWPARRTVGRGVLPAAFFERVRGTEPDPETGEVDDVPVYREMIQSRPALGVSLTCDLYDMGEPDRYLRVCAHAYRRSRHS